MCRPPLSPLGNEETSKWIFDLEMPVNVPVKQFWESQTARPLGPAVSCNESAYVCACAQSPACRFSIDFLSESLSLSSQWNGRSYGELFSSSEIGSQLDSSFSMSCRKRINTDENTLRSVLTLRSTPTLLFLGCFLFRQHERARQLSSDGPWKWKKKEVGELMSIRQATRECQDPYFFVGGVVWGWVLFTWPTRPGKLGGLYTRKGAFNCWSLFNTLRFRRGGGSRMTWRVFPFTPEYPCKVRPEKLDWVVNPKERATPQFSRGSHFQRTLSYAHTSTPGEMEIDFDPPLVFLL
jgi:hypothetical protein